MQSIILNGSKIISNYSTVLIDCSVDKKVQLLLQYYKQHQCPDSDEIKKSWWLPFCFRNLIFKRKLSCWIKTKAEHSTFTQRKQMKNSTMAWQLLEVSSEQERLRYSWCSFMKPAKKIIQIIAHSQGALEKKSPGTLSGRLHHSHLPGTNPINWWIKAAGSWK